MKDAEETRTRGPKKNSPEERDPDHNSEGERCASDARLLDWIEATMDTEERERMLAIPDHDADSLGEVERQERIGHLLTSLPADPAPAELWSEVTSRIRSSRVSLAPPLIRRVLRYRKTLAACAAGLLLAVTFLVADPFGSPETSLNRWIVIDEDQFEATMSSVDRVNRELLMGSWPVGGSPDEMFMQLSGGRSK